ncbi:MAG: carboxypeptidase regulatory-like domain-containing protein [Bryobacteraceae bacterium]|nr:carboxypeptidase regulatory-like domain-containing protein [Bryobacteraceae bacterium]
MNQGRLLLAMVALAGSLLAQTTSTIAGKILDPSGLAVSKAKISARHLETGFMRMAYSDDGGLYAFTTMPVGGYEMRVEAAGFRPAVRKGIQLTVAETSGIDFTLQVGAVDQEITVTAEAPPVNTSTAELSYLVNERTMRDLPLNGRNYTDLALLQPGVVAFPSRDGGSVVAHGLGTSINGADPRSNVYLLDGQPQNDFTNGPAGSAAGTVLGIETIREFRVETNAYSAEYGRNFGGQINVLTKSGTNEFHGNTYWFFRNDNFDARNFFDPATQPKFTRNQYGATLGGPLKKDKSFFFLGWEALRERLGRSILSVVPDENARRGILPDPNNPALTTTVAVSPAVQPWLREIPLPNGGNIGSGLGNYLYSFNQRIRQDYGQGRWDQNLTGNQQMFGRYTYDGAVQDLPTEFPQFPRQFVSRNQFATAEHRWVISPTLLNTVRVSFSRTRIAQEVFSNTTEQLPRFAPGAPFTGQLDIGGASRFGPQSSVDVRLVQNVYGFEDGLSLTRGKHLIKAGFLAERYQNNMVNPTFSLGNYAFANIRSFLLNQPIRFVGLAPGGALDRYWRTWLFGAYVQDNWRISRRLTLNLGLRWEASTMPRDIYGRDSALPNVYTDAAPITGRLFENPPRANFAPRFGFAWDVFGDGKTSLRGGYGIFFNTNQQQQLIVTVTNPPATPRVIFANPTFPNPNFNVNQVNSIRPIEWNIKSPYAQTWNLNVQRNLVWDTVLTVGYAGSRGIHLMRSADVNTAIPTVRPDGTLFFPPTAARVNPNFTTIELKKSDGRSWYNAMIVDVRKRFSRGLTVQSSYTFSRNIDTTQGSTFFSDATSGTTTAFPEFPGFEYNKGLADYHAKHNWVFNFTYQFPRAGFELLNGWMIGGIANMRSGQPVTLFLQNNWSRSRWSPSLGPGIGLDRPSLAAGRTHQDAVLGSPDRFFDPSAFVLPEQGTLGNLGRGALIGPNLRTFDMVLSKNTPLPFLGESGNLQFRAEAFNLFNRANFGVGPPALLAFAGQTAADRPLPGFGVLRSTVTSARQIQFGLKLQF